MILFLINYFAFQYIYFACLRLQKIILLYIDFYHSLTTSNIYIFLSLPSESIGCMMIKTQKKTTEISIVFNLVCSILLL